MGKPSTPRRAVKVWLAQHDRTQAWLAAKLGISESTLSKIISGNLQPALDVAVRIEELTGIPARHFAKVA